MFVSALRDTKVIGAREKLTTAQRRPGVAAMAYATISPALMPVSSAFVILAILASFVNNRSISARRISVLVTALALVDRQTTSANATLVTRGRSVSKRSISVQRISAAAMVLVSIGLQATSVDVILDTKENFVRKRKIIANPTRA